MAVESISSSVVVIKSPNEKRTYKLIQLPNGLCALLIHDPEIHLHEPSNSGEEEEESDGEEKLKGSMYKKSAAAAMCVGAGSFLDPLEAQGLAHFLEHMLFMGSAKFPIENEFDSYLSKHGGSSNAHTGVERACYHFVVNSDFLKGALLRFAQFFIAPLMKAEAMEREILAVDSEFNEHLQDDEWRLQQLKCYTSAPGHPFNRFFIGNKKSLSDAVNKGVNLREQILKFYNDNYSGESMKLVVIGGETLDILEDWVVELFSSIKKGHLVKLDLGLDTPIWKTGKVYWLEAVQTGGLELSWTLPSMRKDYLKKAELYLAHLLGHAF